MNSLHVQSRNHWLELLSPSLFLIHYGALRNDDATHNLPSVKPLWNPSRAFKLTMKPTHHMASSLMGQCGRSEGPGHSGHVSADTWDLTLWLRDV